MRGTFFRKHVTHLLAAYQEDALAPHARQRVERHLQSCAACRRTDEALRVARLALTTIPTVVAPERLWERIELVLPPPPATLPARNKRSGDDRARTGRRRRRSVCAFVLACCLIGIFWKQHSSQQKGGHSPVVTASWKVERLAGAPIVGTALITAGGNLGVGQRLVTDARSRARVQVADIGQVEIAPNSQIRLVQTQANRQRLALDRGELSAHVIAPPRLFLVDTPSAVAVDLGCAYTLHVDDGGNSRLHVTKGSVALEQNGVETQVPAGAICNMRKGVGTGTPYFADAPPTLLAAVARMDAENGGDEALKTILDTARLQDSLTLFYLLYRVTPMQRERVIDGLLSYVEFPDGVTRAGIRKLDPQMLKLWKEQMEFAW